MGDEPHSNHIPFRSILFQLSWVRAVVVIAANVVACLLVMYGVTCVHVSCTQMHVCAHASSQPDFCVPGHRPFVGSVEVMRRAMWSVFRLEHRYLVQLRKSQESLGALVVIRRDTNSHHQEKQQQRTAGGADEQKTTASSTWDVVVGRRSGPPKLQPLGIDGDQIFICKRGRRRRQSRRERLSGSSSDSGHSVDPSKSGLRKHARGDDIQQSHRKSERRRRGDKANAKKLARGRRSQRRQKKKRRRKKKQQPASAAATLLLSNVAEGAADLAHKVG